MFTRRVDRQARGLPIAGDVAGFADGRAASGERAEYVDGRRAVCRAIPIDRSQILKSYFGDQPWMQHRSLCDLHCLLPLGLVIRLRRQIETAHSVVVQGVPDLLVTDRQIITV